MPPLTILLLIFSGMILLYAALLAVTKDEGLLPLRGRPNVKPKEKKAYLVQFAKVLALVALAPAAAGIVGIWSEIGAGVTFVAGLILTIYVGTKIIEKRK